MGDDGLSPGWLRRHAVAAPIGICIITVALTVWSEADRLGWQIFQEPAASMVDWAVVLYATGAVLVEKGLDVMWWALEQKRKRRERYRQEIADEVRPEVREEERPGIIAEARPAIIEEERPGIIAEARPAIIEEARPGIIEEARPAIEEAAREDERKKHEERIANLLQAAREKGVELEDLPPPNGT